MVESVAPCRPNVMSLKYILSSDPALMAAPNQAIVKERLYKVSTKKVMVEARVPRRLNNQATVQERKINASTPLSVLVNRTGPEVSVHAPPFHQSPPVDVNNISIYLDDFDDSEAPVVQLCSPVPRNLASPVLGGWAPLDGSEDIDIDHEDLGYPSHVSNPTSHHVYREHDMSEDQAARLRAKSKVSTYPPAELPRLRVVFAPTQPTSSTMTRRTLPPLSYGPPKGGIPPRIARDVTKSQSLRAEQENKRKYAAAARAAEGRKPSVQTDGLSVPTQARTIYTTQSPLSRGPTKGVTKSHGLLRVVQENNHRKCNASGS